MAEAVAAAVLFEQRLAGGGRFVGYATLNAEKSLNSLSLEMVRLLSAQLREWAVSSRTISSDSEFSDFSALSVA